MSLRPENRTTPFLILMGLCFFILFSRLYYLQVIRGEYYLKRSESNFIQERVIKHNRGKIIDSQNRVLVDNRLSYDLFVTFALLPDSLRSLRTIAAPLNLTKLQIQDLNQELVLQAKARFDQEIPVIIDGNIEICRDLRILVQSKLIPGINIVQNNTRKKCNISIDSSEFPSQSLASNRLRDLLKINENDFQELWQKANKKAQGLARFKPVPLMSDIGFDAYARIENAISLGLLAGVTVVPAKRRRYIYDDLATHVIGFLNQVSVDELRDNKNNYRSGDYIGRKGIEASFENELRGQDGIERLVVDAKGRRFSEEWEEELLGSTRQREPQAGKNVKLTIDADLQRYAQSIFGGISGSVIVMDVNTGFIKAMASFPSFDPNIIVSADNAKQLKELFNDKSRPFRNKAVQDHYPPGSTFKAITAIAGLNKQVITPYYTHYCSGQYRIHKTMWRCFKREGHGPIALAEALRVSCDNYFYELGHRLGLDYFSNIAAKLGFGQPTDITLSGETPGILPSTAYYRKRFGYVAPGFVVNMAIGQGDLSASPIQLAVAYAALANGGIILQPQLVEEIFDEEGKSVKHFSRVVKATIADSSLDFAEIVKGLSFVTEPGGSASSLMYKPEYLDIARWIKANNIRVTGKTGTAQVVSLSKAVEHSAKDVAYEQRDHAWFVGIFHEIVVVVMTEHGGLGGATSAPVAVRLMKKWHEQNDSMVLGMRQGDD